MGQEFNDFINNRNVIEQIEKIVLYNPNSSFIILDSQFTRRSIYYKYSHLMSFFSGSLEKSGYSFVCRIDQTNSDLGARELLQKYKKPLLITGIGLYGQMFIRDVRMFERVSESTDDRCPIILMGSPRPEKLETMQGQYDLLISNTEEDAFLKLDWILSRIIQSKTELS